MRDPLPDGYLNTAVETPKKWLFDASRWLGARWVAVDWWAVDAMARRHLLPFSVVLFVCLFLILHVDRAVIDYFRGLDAGTQHVIGKISDIGKSTWWLVLGVSLFAYFWFVYGWRLMANRAMFLVAAVALSGILTNILKTLMGRARPKVMYRDPPYYGFDPGALDSAYHSFPSGHTTTATALAVTGLLIWPRGWPLFLAFALLIGFTRVALTAHFPADVVAAFYVTTLFVFALARHWERKFGPLTPIPPNTPKPVAALFRWMKRTPPTSQRVGTGVSPE